MGDHRRIDEGAVWRSYEEVAIYLLDQIARAFGLKRVEQGGKVSGHRSGTEWALDGRGFVQDGDAFVIIECRRCTGSRMKQEDVGALAYRISDTGASGAILVSPVGLQEGAQRVAAAERVISVVLDEDSTTTDFVLQFVNRIWVGIGERGQAVDTVSVVKGRPAAQLPQK